MFLSNYFIPIEALLPLLDSIEDPPKSNLVCKQWYSYRDILYKQLFTRLQMPSWEHDYLLKENTRTLKQLMLVKAWKILSSNDAYLMRLITDYEIVKIPFVKTLKLIHEHLFEVLNLFSSHLLTTLPTENFFAETEYAYVNPWTGFTEENIICELKESFTNGPTIVLPIKFCDQVPIGAISLNRLQRNEIRAYAGSYTSFKIVA